MRSPKSISAELRKTDNGMHDTRTEPDIEEIAAESNNGTTKKETGVPGVDGAEKREGGVEVKPAWRVPYRTCL
jgi:hypothetical protein